MAVTAVATFPTSLDKGPLERVRRPLAAIAALILVIDLIGLGLHLADAVSNPLTDDAPTRTRARTGAPEAVVPPSASPAARQVSGPQPVKPVGCLALNSGCYAGPAPAGPTQPTGPTTKPPASPTAPKPTPLAQADLAVPALGTQASLGLGDGGCTGLTLLVLALGDCPAAQGDGAVVLHLGGSLLGD